MSLDSILRATGKNLFNKSTLTAGSSVVELTQTTNGFTFKTSATSKTMQVGSNIYLTAGTYYCSGTTACSDTSYKGGWAVYDNETGKFIINASSRGTINDKFTITESKTYQLNFYAPYNAPVGVIMTFENVQLEKGSTATTYEPYEYLGPKTINLGRKSKNLILYPYTETTKTQKGITFTDNGDGTITVNGTSTGLATFTLGSVSLDNTKSYFLSGKNTSSNLPLRIQIGQTWRAEEGNGLAISQAGGNHCTITLGALKGFTFDNVIIYPQLEEGSVATDYELNTGSKEVLKVSYNSRNLIPYPYFSNTITNNGVTYTVNANGSIKVSGTASADNNSVFFIRINALPLTLKQGEQYTLSGHIEDSGITFSMQDSNFIQTISVTNTTTSKSFTTLYSNYYMWIVVIKGTTVDTVVYPQLEMGNKATDYVPYFNTTVWTKKA